jgi:transmembrane sensor
MTANEETRRLEQAAAWRLRLAGLRSETCPELKEWLAADARNCAAWCKVQTPWEILGDHATSPEIIHLRRAALAHANGAGAGFRSRIGSNRLPALAASAAAVLVAIGAVLLWQSYHHFDVYRTQAGERRTETLSDGSEITLDSNSEVRVRYSKHSRELVLASGQALFNVAHDVLRPFSVAADRHEIVATGTSFNVDLLGPQLLVTLLEGHVIVVPHDGDRDWSGGSGDVPSGNGVLPGPDPPAARIEMDAGEQLTVSSRDAPRITRVNVDHAVAWEKGSLVFKDEPLASVVRRVGRYSEHRIVIADESTANLRVSGVFREGDVEGFVSTVVNYLPVLAEHESDGSVRLGAASAPAAP